jgi:hypothetical protein
VFGPHPLLTVTVERQGEADDVHLHTGERSVVERPSSAGVSSSATARGPRIA